MNTTSTYLKTLRRIPDDIVLSMASRDIVPADPCKCICGWAIREDIALGANVPAERVSAPVFVSLNCTEAFGGTYREWGDLFRGICDEDAPLVEAAFVTRVMEAVGVAS